MIRRCFLPLLLLLFSCLLANAQITFSSASVFKYLKGKDAAALPQNWMTSNYNSQDWQTGNAPFWYGDGANGTQLQDMQNSYSTVYLLSTFKAQNISELQDVHFLVDFDDAFIVWINGVEALRVNAPNIHPNNSFASGQHESGTAESYTLPTHDLNLIEGDNVIAIQGFNVNLESSDFHFSIQIGAQISQPINTDTLKVVFSQPHGFYSDPFELKLDVPDQAYSIIYTVDGSNPQSSTTVQDGGKSKIIKIDPSISFGRDQTPCFIVRASLKKEGNSATFPLTQTYIFLNEVITQAHPGGNWPSGNSVNGQIVDLKMDSRVTADPKYSGLMKDAFTDIPSISVVTDLKNLFDPVTGIYVNAMAHGETWERFCSVELINPSGKSGFSINGGLRIRGGWSRHPQFPKHAFRLFFKEEYGASKLRFPLFENEGVSEFDKIDLRCEQNYAWSKGDNVNRYTAVREVFSRDTQRDMEQPYTRSRYYHLYLNGMYWGLYQTQERSEARFSESYFGGSDEDYDVVKVNTEGYTVEATHGNLNSWQKIYNLCAGGFGNNSAYYALQGKDQFGNPQKGGEVMINIDNLIDYMQVIFYTGNFDAPTSAFGKNAMANNFFAIDKRDDRSSGFSFYAHDSEHSMMIEPEGPGVGLYENRVQLNMTVNGLNGFHPGWLHHRLTQNTEYIQRFADRAYKHFYNKGVFVPEIAIDRFQKRVDEIDKAVICESARWGDFTTKTNPPFTFENWDKEIKDIYARFFPFRTNIVINQLKASNLIANFNPPTYTKNNILIDQESYPATGKYNIIVSSSTGLIYYTLDGTDPRLIGGNVSSQATEIKSGSTIELDGTAIIQSRVKLGEQWSALATVKFLNPIEDFTNLKVTELHYHPTDSIAGSETISDKSFEFIEFKNIGIKPINLNGLHFDTSIEYKFGENEILCPNQFYVIASKPKWFYERHFQVPSGNFEKNLSNSGEQIVLANSNKSPIIDFQYSTFAPWTTLPDGSGKSLTAAIINPIENPNNHTYWAASSVYGGTPFADDLGIINSVIINPFSVNTIAIYPNPTKGLLYLKAKDQQSIVRVEIYTLSGIRINQSVYVGNGEIDFNRLNIRSGMYLINTVSDGKIMVNKVIYQP